MTKPREVCREFYEERVERELNEKYIVRIKNYRRARKQYLRHQKLTSMQISKTVNSVNYVRRFL